MSSTPDFIGYYYGNDTGAGAAFLEQTFLEKNVYFDDTYENICIELNNLPDGEEVEVEFITTANAEGGII